MGNCKPVCTAVDRGFIPGVELRLAGNWLRWCSAEFMAVIFRSYPAVITMGSHQFIGKKKTNLRWFRRIESI